MKRNYSAEALERSAKLRNGAAFFKRTDALDLAIHRFCESSSSTLELFLLKCGKISCRLRRGPCRIRFSKETFDVVLPFLAVVVQFLLAHQHKHLLHGHDISMRCVYLSVLSNLDFIPEYMATHVLQGSVH